MSTTECRQSPRWADTQAVPIDGCFNGMQAQRVRAIGGTRRKHASQRIAFLRSRMDLKDIAACLVKPRDDDELVSGKNAVQGLDGPGMHVEPHVGRALGSLFGGIGAPLDVGPDHTDRAKLNPADDSPLCHRLP